MMNLQQQQPPPPKSSSFHQPLQQLDTNQLSSPVSIKRILENSSTIKLSRILQSIPNFSFFDELINFPIPSDENKESIKLSNHDLYKISKILDDIDLYLNDIRIVFNNIKKVSKNINNLLDWYFEGKNNLLELLRNLDNIDSIISQLLLIIENCNNQQQIQFNPNLIKKFENLNDLLFEIKKSSILLKKNLDISINYKELIENIIIHLIYEIEDCIKNIVKLKEFKISSPKRILPKFNLVEIITKMRINDFSTNINFNSIKLPTFNDLDEKLYNDYLKIESKIDPLKISVNVVPLKIDEFNNLCLGNLFKSSREYILNNYEILLDKWNLLQKEMNVLKVENIDIKWNEVFNYLINQIEIECDNLIDLTCNLQDITDEVASKYKLCSNSITLIQKANKEKTITDYSIISGFNTKLLPKWQQVNDLVVNNKNLSKLKSKSDIVSVPPSTKSSEINDEQISGLRPFQTKSRGSSSNYDKPPTSNGYGIDLNIDVNSTTLPLSIQKRDRIKNLQQQDIQPSNRKNLRNSLISVFEYFSFQSEEEEDATLVKSDTKNVNNNNRLISFNYSSYFNIIINSSVRFKSKLPRIMPNYIKLGYPIILKVTSTNSKIPEINPTHPVFNSPYKKNEHFKIKSLNSSPLKNKKEIKSRSSSSSIATVIGRPNSLLNEMKIPNLTYSRRLSYNSSSPERPLSSLGSRFDDENLIQNCKNFSKPIWN
ncbi:unnamed protein product [Candida verbasci]|uniref:Karyogamy protein n=1 Tax=Candida verbasci TaxID=1227364 RepID=A0A9W4TU90_9ASCO|nr:unnamed protein product [Candida verbasci]